MNDWGFDGKLDARRYLSDVLRLWAGWLLGLAALMFTQGWWVVVAGVITVAILVVFARPMQARAAALVPEDTLVGNRYNVVGRGTARDKALQAFAYGPEPLEQATTIAGTGRWMLVARPVMIWVTVAAFIFVLLTSFGGPVS